jgi:general secretion pathway protein A
MQPIYSLYFGLKEAPFNITPDPSFLFESKSHQEGLAQMRYGIEARRGFIVLTGEDW